MKEATQKRAYTANDLVDKAETRKLIYRATEWANSTRQLHYAESMAKHLTEKLYGEDGPNPITARATVKYFIALHDFLQPKAWEREDPYADDVTDALLMSDILRRSSIIHTTDPIAQAKALIQATENYIADKKLYRISRGELSMSDAYVTTCMLKDDGSDESGKAYDKHQKEVCKLIAWLKEIVTAATYDDETAPEQLRSTLAGLYIRYPEVEQWYVNP